MFHKIQNMDGDYSLGAVLKQQLNELDDIPQKDKFIVGKLNKMSVPPDAVLDNNLSDFDNSDEDLASLLADDDDDIFAKKTFGSTASEKKSSNEKSGFSPKKVTDKYKHDEKITSSKSSSKPLLSKDNSKEDSDALDNFLSDSSLPFLKDGKRSSPIKGDSLRVGDDESKYLDDLGFNQLSDNMSSNNHTRTTIKSKSSVSSTAYDNPEEEDILKSLESDNKAIESPHKSSGSFLDDFLKKLSPKNSPIKTIGLSSLSEKLDADKSNEDDSEDDDLLKSLESDEIAPDSPKKRSGSVFDDFLKSISPKQSPKKSAYLVKSDSLEKKTIDTIQKGVGNDDTFGKTISSDPKKSVPSLPKHSTPENRRESLLKQVSFKGIPDVLPENESPVKEIPLFSPKRQPTKTESEVKTKSAPQPRRSERMGASNKDDTDWLNFFKESPKKTKKPEPLTMQKKDSIPDDRQPSTSDFKSNSNRRRSSSAEWLGLNEKNVGTKSNVPIMKERMPKEPDDDWLAAGEPVKVSRPQTSPEFAGKMQEQDVTHTVSRPKTSTETSKRTRQLDVTQTVDLNWLDNDKNTSVEQNKVVDSTKPLKKKNQLSLASNVPVLDEMSIKSVVGESQDFTQTISTHKISADSHLYLEREESNFFPSEFVIQNKSATANPPLMSRPYEDAPAIKAVKKDTGLSQAYHTDPGGSAIALQSTINKHILERDQLAKSSEAMKLMYEERIETLENLHSDQLKSMEESLRTLENRLKVEIRNTVQTSEEKLSLVQNDKKLLEKDFKDKLEDLEKQSLKDIQKLKELHSQSVDLMKQDHEDALNRLKRLKEQEIEAVLSTQSHSRSLQQLTDQLEARASELASLQIKVEERNHATLKDKQAVLEAKERDLKSLQNRLQRQLEEGDEDRSRLQQLVLRLESRLQKYAAEGEEDRWEVQQMKAKLSVQQKHLDEEYKLQIQQVEKEKEKLRLSQDSLLHEQKTVLLQLAQERQQLMREKVEMEALAKKIKEEETRLHVKKLKEESFIECQKRFLQQEENRLYFEKSNVKHELELLEQERHTVQSERQLLKEERMKLSEFNFKIKRKENEVEVMAMSSSEERERAQAEHASAVKIKAEQQTRMQQITYKMQELMEKEHHILAEKEKLSEERLELENKKKSTLCNKCKLSLGLPVNAPPLGINSTPVSNINSAPLATFPLSHGISNSLELSRQDPSLVVWYITAQRDREYLREELSFLRSLKDSSKTQKKV